jgi:hypothetical protein
VIDFHIRDNDQNIGSKYRYPYESAAASPWNRRTLPKKTDEELVEEIRLMMRGDDADEDITLAVKIADAFEKYDPESYLVTFQRALGYFAALRARGERG